MQSQGLLLFSAGHWAQALALTGGELLARSECLAQLLRRGSRENPTPFGFRGGSLVLGEGEAPAGAMIPIILLHDSLLVLDLWQGLGLSWQFAFPEARSFGSGICRCVSAFEPKLSRAKRSREQSNAAPVRSRVHSFGHFGPSKPLSVRTELVPHRARCRSGGGAAGCMARRQGKRLQWSPLGVGFNWLLHILRWIWLSMRLGVICMKLRRGFGLRA